MTLAAPAIAKSAKPGQFIMVRTADSYQPFLRRPFGIHNVKGSNVDILYELAGAGTKILSQKKSGETLNIIGPLGNGFKLDPRPYTLNPIFIAGGMGVAPLVYLAAKLKKLKPVVLLGAKTKSHILCEKEFKALGCDIKIATDDGSKGCKGFVSDLLQDVITGVGATRRAATTIYACGPKPMLKAITKIAKQHSISARLSLEEHMACGIGACLGCVVNTTHGQKRVCKDGPVFNAEEIVWED
jgi:dihydroorotate dehydrogenase electron transfer subunit